MVESIANAKIVKILILTFLNNMNTCNECPRKLYKKESINNGICVVCEKSSHFIQPLEWREGILLDNHLTETNER